MRHHPKLAALGNVELPAILVEADGAPVHIQAVDLHVAIGSEGDAMHGTVTGDDARLPIGAQQHRPDGEVRVHEGAPTADSLENDLDGIRSLDRLPVGGRGRFLFISRAPRRDPAR